MGEKNFKARFLYKLNDDWKAYQQKENTLEAIAFQKGLAGTITLYKEAAEYGPKSILETEQMILAQEMGLYANSPEMLSSLIPALQELKDALDCFEQVYDKDGYTQSSKLFSGKNKQGGLPLDTVRKFISSHQARLSNRLKENSSRQEKKVLLQRKGNLKTANEAYKKLQRKALGIENAKGISR
ncbi:hypothetical protein [Maridesulfovibrio hydrothermalis]|uniref:Uncharacterized protein n=1 Tax=Maridesulfovibrio hydrothermalis AM13 = DSM 14728 TaxID=1121451 RepID=L0R5Q0_9BACT|nr:hypothetical protein [Maridesulfovibrio hydrothermalis]CCO21984.1 conserved protein of unknown function [Maridesulfovibrio hydrothermalis AM13 = DSM 14728]